MSLLKTVALTFLAATGVSAGQPQCCNVCPDGWFKTFSIDTVHGHCGESCIEHEYMFNVYKIFEKNLEMAGSNSEHSCALHGYTKYYETATHGIPHVFSATVDLYSTPAAYAANSAQAAKAVLLIL